MYGQGGMSKRQFRGQERTPPKSQLEAAPSAFRQRRFWILIGCLGALLVGLWYFGSLAALPRIMVERSLAARDFESAWRWTDVADWLSYRNPANALLTARIARSEGDAERMRRELKRATQWGADPQAVRREQLLAMAQSGQLDEIESELMQWLGQSGAETDEISDAYANGLAAQGRFDEALGVLEAWRKDFPADPRPDHRIGRIQEHQQRYDEAEAHYRGSLNRQSNYYPSRYSLGRVLLNQRRADEAVEQFRQCLDMPLPLAAQVQLATALKAQGKADEARPWLKQVLAAPAEKLEASYQSLEERPELFVAAAEYGRLEADAGNFQEARPWLEAALKANPLDLMSRYALAVTLRGLRLKPEADEQFARVNASREAMGAAGELNARIKRNPEDLQARLNLGKLILTHESESSGLYWIRSIFAYDPDYGPAHEALAEYFQSRADQDPSYARLAAQHRSRARAAHQNATPP
jgi:tetratricopeptide (TPR) repeat protein